MAPEQLSKLEYSYPIDVWALGIFLLLLGITLIELAEQRVPHSDVSIQKAIGLIRDGAALALKAQFSGEIRDFASKCLQKNQKARWTPEQLLNHEFINKYRTKHAQIRKDFVHKHKHLIKDQIQIEESTTLL